VGVGENQKSLQIMIHVLMYVCRYIFLLLTAHYMHSVHGYVKSIHLFVSFKTVRKLCICNVADISKIDNLAKLKIYKIIQYVIQFLVLHLKTDRMYD
jgi:hypothetical protein